MVATSPSYSRWVDVPNDLRTRTQWRRKGRTIRKGAILSPYIPHRLELRDGGRLREWLLTLMGCELVNL